MRSSGLPGNLCSQTLVMLRADIHFFRGGQRHSHGPCAATATASSCARLLATFPVTHSNAPFGQIVYTQRIPKCLRQFLEFEHFFGIGLFVDAMQRRDSALFQILGDRLVCGEHEFLD